MCLLSPTISLPIESGRIQSNVFVKDHCDAGFEPIWYRTNQLILPKRLTCIRFTRYSPYPYICTTQLF